MKGWVILLGIWAAVSAHAKTPCLVDLLAVHAETYAPSVVRPETYYRTPIRNDRIPKSVLLRFKHSSFQEMIDRIRSEGLLVGLVQPKNNQAEGLGKLTPSQQEHIDHHLSTEGWAGMYLPPTMSSLFVEGRVEQSFQTGVILVRRSNDYAQLKMTLLHEYIHYLNDKARSAYIGDTWNGVPVPFRLYRGLVADANYKASVALEKALGGEDSIDLVNDANTPEEVKAKLVQHILVAWNIRFDRKMENLVEEADTFLTTWDFAEEMEWLRDRRSEEWKVGGHMRDLTNWMESHLDSIHALTDFARSYSPRNADLLEAAQSLQNKLISAERLLKGDIARQIPSLAVEARAVAEHLKAARTELAVP